MRLKQQLTEEQPVEAERELMYLETECEEAYHESKEYKRSRSEYLREHEVRIKFLTLGCVIEVGCKAIPFTTVEEGMKALNEYVANPHETIRVLNKKCYEEE
tara:strand:+ start:2668 stop:2973 length:306 start_codon:yes stop_codon:yes gene_type:complete